MSCIFCDIVTGKIPCTKVYENDSVLAFEDINPAAPVHILVIPKKHIEGINELNINDNNNQIMNEIFSAVDHIAKLMDLDSPGYRTIINKGKASGQEVFHLHIHILAGKDHLGPMLA